VRRLYNACGLYVPYLYCCNCCKRPAKGYYAHLLAGCFTFYLAQGK